jgi:peptidoglycan/xylan/chitin deacetylase (PgdA/CDA1 family)
MRHMFHRLHRRLASARPAPVILAYHRIAAPSVDPWRLAVSPTQFRTHLAFLKRHRRPMAMSEFISRLNARDLPSDAVALTFDDGYRDNLINAKPLLLEYAVPASIFLATGYIGKRQEFWWDELARLTLGRREGMKSQIPLGNDLIEVVFAPMGTDGPAVDSWQDGDPIESARARAYFELWSKLRDLDWASRETSLAAIRKALDTSTADDESGPVCASDIAELAVANLIEIGAHSVTHPRLTKLSPDEQRHEIRESKQMCERLSGQPVLGFTYPHGDLDHVTQNLVRDAGFHWACTTHSAFVDIDRYDLFAMPRVQAINNMDMQVMLAHP